MRINNLSSKILTLFCTFLLVIGCSSQMVDKSLKTESYSISEGKVKEQERIRNSMLTGVYQGIDDMYEDSDYVVSGVVKEIEYFEVQPILLRKINVLVNKSYKGTITENNLISILENDGYLRLKSLYEEAKKEYEEKYGNTDKEREDAYLNGITLMSDIKDIENDMLIKYYYFNKEDSKVGDELLLFLTDSSDDTYKDKKVKLSFSEKLSYPKGAYAPLGLGMGKFTRVADSYKRYNLYYTPEGTIIKGMFGGIQKINESYPVKEMEDELKKLK